MSKKRIKKIRCPNCSKIIYRKKVKKHKPTFCNYCGFKIDNPYKEVILTSQ